MTAWLTIVGIGEDGWEGLGTLAQAAIREADTLVGGERHLALIPEGAAKHQPWEKPLDKTLEKLLANRGAPVTILATGDPMWFGIGATLAKRVPADEMRVIPSPSAFSLAAGRMGWPLAETECLSVHGRALERIRPFVQPGAKLLLLAGGGGTPAEVAVMLVEMGYGDSVLTAFEHMGGPAEKRTQGTAAQWPGPVADLNTLAVDCRAGTDAPLRPRAPGLPDDAFAHDGQLTKREVRAATLAALAPLPGQYLWDVGAGSGSVAIEWMRSSPGARATAMERDPDRLKMVEDNALFLGVPDLDIRWGAAEESIFGLDAPNAAFVGGGLSVPGLAETCWQQLKPQGRFVANAVTLEGERRLIELAEITGGELVRFEISRASATGRFTTWAPMKPVTQLRAVKS